MIGSLWNRTRRGHQAPRAGFVDSQTGAGGAVRADSREGLIPIPDVPKVLEGFVDYSRSPVATFSRTGKNQGVLLDREAAIADALRPTSDMTVAEQAVALDLLTEEEARRIEEARTLHVQVDQRHRRSPAFVTWESDLRSRDIPCQVETLSAQDLAERRRARGSVESAEDAGLQVRQQAKTLFENLAFMGASDLHIVVRAGHTEIQARIKGELRTIPSMSMQAEEGDRLIRAIVTGLTTSKESTFNIRDFQNAQINGAVFPGTSLSSIRIIRGPSYPIDAGGQFLVARLQYGTPIERPVGRRMEMMRPAPPNRVSRLAAYGFTAKQLNLLDEIMRNPHGVCFVTGPTGAGKTTTLNDCLAAQATLYPESRQITMEHPVEIPMPWAIQLDGDSDEWEETLNHTLRMDPDILLFGEIRSVIEARAAVRAAMTGHFVWTTMHINCPFETFARLEQLDRKEFGRDEMCDPGKVVGMVGQRLVGKLCPHCAKPLDRCSEIEVPTFIRDRLRTWDEGAGLSNVRIRGDGCHECDGGIIGRTAVAEVVVADEALLEKIKNEGVIAARRWHRARPGADKSMLANGMPLVLSGDVSPMDIHRQIKMTNREDA